MLFFVGILLFGSSCLFAQENSSHTMNFVRAVQFESEGRNHILVVFKVVPIISNFKLILSMRVAYSIGHGEKVVDIQKQKEDNIRIVVYGKDIEKRNEKLYNLIKDRVHVENAENVRFITFDFYDVTEEKIDRMKITYGLWESGNSNIRNEQEYNFTVDQIY